jgi:hypothetical protein
MIRDHDRQLLTAYVDGELTSRQRRHVVRLLHRSPEARQLLLKLQEDARALRRSPRPQLPVDLSGDVLRTIVERRLTPGQRRIARISTPMSWAGPLASWAAAAAVLLVLGAASYLYFTAALTHSEKPAVVRAAPEDPSPQSAKGAPNPAVSVERGIQPRNGDVSPVSPSANSARQTNPPEVVKRPSETPSKTETNPPAAGHEDAVLTDRLEMFRYSKVEEVLPTVLEVKQLEQESTRNKLIAELRKDANFRIELPSKNGTKALERVRSAATALNIGLTIDKQAQARVKRAEWKTNYVIYLENLTPVEAARFLQLVGAEDRKASRKPVELQFERLVLTRMTANDHKELTTLLGVDPTVTEPAAKGPLGTDPRKPLADLTAEQVGQALAGQGGGRRTDNHKAIAKPPEYTALVLAFNPVRPSPGSVEIKQYLDGRKPAKPGTVRVLLVLRG